MDQIQVGHFTLPKWKQNWFFKIQNNKKNAKQNRKTTRAAGVFGWSPTC